MNQQTVYQKAPEWDATLQVIQGVSTVVDFVKPTTGYFFTPEEFAAIAGQQREEIERLKMLIENAWNSGETAMLNSVFIGTKGDEILYSQFELDRDYNKFKTKNNL